MNTVFFGAAPVVTRRQLLGLTLLLGSQPICSWAQDVMGAPGVRGAGSTFAYPLISQWSREYRAVQARGRDHPTSNTGLDDPPASSAFDYEPVGSLAGMLRVKAGAVDFAVSDVPLNSSELTRLGLAQFPIVTGGVVVAVNLDGVGSGQLRLTGAVLADLYLGQITRWSDPKIAALNPGVRLPDAPVVIVRRADGSGTTYNFTKYLEKSSATWRERVGSDLLVSWPVGVGARGNSGMARAVSQTKNTIGYIEYAAASQAKLNLVQIQNRSGTFVVPGQAAFAAASRQAAWRESADFDLLLIDTPGADVYPIVATVFVFMSKSAPAAKTSAVLDFFQWSLDRGSDRATRLGYVPLPPDTVQLVKNSWSKLNWRSSGVS